MPTHAITIDETEAAAVIAAVDGHRARPLPIEHGMGWLRDLPDFRDYTAEHEEVQPQLAKLDAAQAGNGTGAGLDTSVDLREWFSPIEDQGQLGSCTANAGVGMVEYFERRAHGKHIDASRLFLYKVSRELLHFTGDTGAFLRTTMGALRLFGVPPEEYWPYDIVTYDREPPAFCYAFAQNYQAMRYYRLDPPGTSPDDLLARIKTNLSANLPSMFGFTVYSSITQADSNGEIPYPAAGERAVGGHAIVAAGYDDGKTIRNASGGQATTGAFLIRNSWGPGWGDAGYGWLPYEYVHQGLAVDWWSLIKNEWVDTGRFSQ